MALGRYRVSGKLQLKRHGNPQSQMCLSSVRGVPQLRERDRKWITDRYTETKTWTMINFKKRKMVSKTVKVITTTSYSKNSPINA